MNALGNEVHNYIKDKELIFAVDSEIIASPLEISNEIT